MITSQKDFQSGEVAGISRNIPVKSGSVESLVGDWMQNLGAKQKLILSGRFGISGREPQTLEAIGKSLNITRERVRQIEADALTLLKKAKKSAESEEFIDTVNEIISELGGIAETDSLSGEVFEKYFGKSTASAQEKYFLEIAFSAISLKRIKGNKEVKDAWVSPGFDLKRFRTVAAEIEKIFDENKKLFPEEELLRKIDHAEFAKNASKLPPEQILNTLAVSKKFGKNVFGSWGKAKWPLVRPRGVREKATLVLLNQRKPLHFREISRLIEKLGLSDKKVHPQTVHNELIREKRFVLVGRGTYALREWGYEEGTVKDIIISVIKSAGGLLNKENIVANVLKKRKVKKATIDVNLSDKKVFQKTKSGYRLK